MFKAIKKIGKGIGKGVNKVKGHVKNTGKKIVKTGKNVYKQTRKDARHALKHLKHNMIDKIEDTSKKVFNKGIGKKLMDVVTDPDAMGNPLLIGAKLAAPKLYNKINHYKDIGASIAQNITGIPISDMRNNIKGVRNNLGLSNDDNNKSDKLLFKPNDYDPGDREYEESNISSIAPSQISQSTATIQAKVHKEPKNSHSYDYDLLG